MYCKYSKYLEVLYYCGYRLYSKCFVIRYGGCMLVLSGFGTANTLIILRIRVFSVLANIRAPVLQYSQHSDNDLFSSIYL